MGRMPSKAVGRLAEHYINLRGLPSNLDPATVLLTEMARCEVAVEYLDAIIMSYTGDDLVALPSIIEASGNENWAMAYHVPMEIWKLWIENRKMLANVSANVVKLGLEERRLAQQDERARQTYMFVQSILSDPTIGLDSHQRRAVGALIAEKLRAELAIEAQSVINEPDPVLRREPPPEFGGLHLVDEPNDDDL